MSLILLENLRKEVWGHLSSQIIEDSSLFIKIDNICRCERNKAPIRFLMAGLLAKMEDPSIDLRKPYSAMGQNSYRGRNYDEDVVQPFIHKYALPCNSTTAYLTPAFRTIEKPLTKEFFNNCRPKEVYYDMMDIIEYVQKFPQYAKLILLEIIRLLFVVKSENQQRIKQLLQKINRDHGSVGLSSEAITSLLKQHLACKGSSRLPVLIIAAAYDTIKELIKETRKPLFAHNAADSQTGALGDIEIVINASEQVVTCYEMKKKKVSIDDINICVEKILHYRNKVDNYIIITTDLIVNEVKDFAAAFYDKIGVEIVVLDCIGFVNHFLHLFHRYRMTFLNNYQALVLAEPDSSVSQPLKEAFLNLRRVAETDKGY